MFAQKNTSHVLNSCNYYFYELKFLGLGEKSFNVPLYPFPPMKLNLDAWFCCGTKGYQWRSQKKKIKGKRVPVKNMLGERSKGKINF